ncbi:MAG: dihydrolipoyl dehydrogenase [Candidatus Omnitrophica bacterium]|nr:dihydrolipoyl dehydrogenase [Candidatus Omnitrophota bacterium]MBU1933346.1 dihydrolipoyl dehydrogenase [Candidatus Omnitrophota bacterium]
MTKYDLAIIGSGPCGYVAAIRAAQSGMRTCVFEKDSIGGACLNWGCIPTKALAASSEILSGIQRAEEFGIDVKTYGLDFGKVSSRKDAIVKKLASGIETLFKARKIDVINGEAKLKDAGRILAGGREIGAKNILIATGSAPFELPGMPFDGECILSSRQFLSLKALPKSMLVIGGGVIGCELSSIYRTFGVDITIIEMLDQLLPGEDREVARKLEQILKRRGINIFTKTKVERLERAEEGIKASLSDGRDIESEKALVCVGRIPDSRGLGIEEIGVEHDRGRVKIDKDFRTNIKNIYAAGDVIGGFLLAHVASREGIASVESMLGRDHDIDYNVVPNCIFTRPEIASVGFTDEKAEERGIKALSRKFLFSAMGKAHVISETEGFVKLVVEADNDKIIGAQIIGPHATDLIAEISPCVQFGITSEKLAGVIHAHPTLSEIIQEVSEAVHNRAIHSI